MTRRVCKKGYCIVTEAAKLGEESVTIHLLYRDMSSLAAGETVLQYTIVYCDQGG